MPDSTQIAAATLVNRVRSAKIRQKQNSNLWYNITLAEPPMSTQPPVDPNKLRAAVSGAIRAHSTFFLIEGVILLVLGVLAILLPPFATLAVTIIFGWIFLVSGMIGFVTTMGARGAPGFWWSLVSAVLATAAGLVLLIQ